MPRENLFQYVRRVYVTAINFPCITPLIHVRSINIREISQVYAIRLKRSRDSLCLSLFISFVCPCPPLVLQYFCPVLCLSVPRSFVPTFVLFSACPCPTFVCRILILSYVCPILPLSYSTFVLSNVWHVLRLPCTRLCFRPLVFNFLLKSVKSDIGFV